MVSRNDYLYQLVGRITDKRVKKKQDGNNFIQLAVIIRDKEIDKINVFADSCPQKIWQTIETNEYINKEYLFRCKELHG